MTDVEKRDAETIGHLKRAEESLQAALKSMPNHVDSAFDPRNDVPALDGALRRTADVRRWAEDRHRHQAAQA